MIHIIRIFVYGVAVAVLFNAFALFIGFEPNPNSYGVAAIAGVLFRFVKELEIESKLSCCEDK